jgi:hypothetical protein
MMEFYSQGYDTGIYINIAGNVGILMADIIMAIIYLIFCFLLGFIVVSLLRILFS